MASGLGSGDFGIVNPGRGFHSIPHSSPTATISLSLTDDDLNEAQETLTLTGAAVGATGLRLEGAAGAFGAVQYAGASDNTVSVVINDNDPITSVTVADAAAVQELGSTAFTVTIDQASAGVVSVAWTADIGGTMGGTPQPASGNLEIPAGDTSADITISIPLNTDLGDGDTRTLTLTLGAVTIAAPGGGTVTTTDTATATVNYITAAHTVTLAAANPSAVGEGASATFTVQRSGPAIAGPDITVTWTVSAAAGGNAVIADDFGGTFPTDSVTFTGTQAAQTFMIRPTDDQLAEMAESFVVTLTATDAVLASNGRVTLGDPATVQITDNDSITIDIGGPRSLNEEGTYRFPVRLSATPTAPLTVNWRVAAAMAGAGSVAAVAGDFADSDGAASMNFPSGTMTFAPGVTEQDIVLRTSAGVPGAGGSADNSPDRVFTLTLSGPAGGGGAAPAAPGPVTVTIRESRSEAIMAVSEAVLPEATRAVVGQQMNAIAGRVGQIGAGTGGPVFNWNGQSTLDGMAAANVRALAADDIDTKELLRDFDFVMPYSHDGGGGGAAAAVWGGSAYHDFSGEDGDTKWDGDMLSFHLGADARIGANSRAGVLISYSDSESDYSVVNNGRRQSGEYQLDLTAVSPYFNWRLADGHSAWVSATYGEGEAEVTPDGETAAANDVTLQGVAAGGNWRLRQAGSHQVRLRADVFVAQTEVQGADDGGITEDMEIDANRARVALAWHQLLNVSGGTNLTRAFDFGVRHDGGDGRSGAGMEVGGQLRYHHAARGLTLQAQARTLLGHTGDHREWGVGGLVRLAAGADGQGLSLSLTPKYGDPATDPQGLWNNRVAADAQSADPEAQLGAELGYGVPMATPWFGLGGASEPFGGGVLTPYSALRIGETSRDYRLGLKWSAARHLDLDLSARRTDTDDAFTLEGRLRF